jgi:hypothetical protein
VERFRGLHYIRIVNIRVGTDTPACAFLLVERAGIDKMFVLLGAKYFLFGTILMGDEEPQFPVARAQRQRSRSFTRVGINRG